MADCPRVVLLLYHHAEYDRCVLQGIARYARIHGPWVFYLAGEEAGLPMPEIEAVSSLPIRTVHIGEGRRRVRLPDLRRWNATGFIGRLQTQEIAEMALGTGVPVIALDLSDEQLAGGLSLARVSEIRPDSHKAGRMAAEHLLDGGFRNFGYCGYAGRTWSQRRQQGFCQRLEEASFTCHVYQPAKHKSKASVPWRRECGDVVNWLRGLPKPVGIMACNDVRGRQVLEASTLGDMPVPYQVAVVGADDDQLLCDLSNPSLSSVAFNARQSGYQAAELLDGLMFGRLKQPQRIDVEPMWVVPRQSTDVVTVEDPEVAAALRFIRENARGPIGVEEVVGQVALSRRALEIRFQRTVGRSIRVEIERVRLAWAKQLLVETDMPTAKIAELAGFSSYSYANKVFRREMGEPPARYRRRHRQS
jgi:LacI family transcriptional regulator